MKNIIYEKSFAAAYKEALKTVYTNPDYVTAPRNMKIKEILNMQITITNPLNNLFKNAERSIPKKYLANELLLYFTGTNESSKFENIASL